MALPATTYDTAIATNPTSALTDFSLLIDLSRMTTAWWAVVDTSDGTKGRAAKDSDETEFATDWIDFDDIGETGWLRVKWSGTLASSGTQTIRIYPPLAANSSNVASATYGSDNAYSSDFIIHYPDAGGTDRTSNANDAVLFNGGIVAGAAIGKTGAGTDFDGSNDWINIPKVFSGLTAATLMVWINVDTAGDSGILWIGTHAANQPWGMWRDENGSSDRLALLITDTGGQYSGVKYGTNGSLTNTGTWYHVCCRFDAGAGSGPEMNLYVDGSLETSVNVAGLTEIAVTSTIHSLGGGVTASKLFDGKMCEFFIADAVVATDAINLEYQQGNSQSTFWGAWANTSPPSARRIFHIL